MIGDANFLLEIGTEEIPAGYLSPAIEFIKKTMSQALGEERIGFREVDVCATPRRIAVFVSGLEESQKEEEVEMKGPSAKAAYDGGGKPTKALEGFLKANSLEAGDTFTRSTEKGDYIFAKKRLESKSTVSIIPGLVEKLVQAVPFPKRMHWSDKSMLFPRPIAYFLILFNDRPVEFELEGIGASNRTRGHYIQHNRMLEVKSIASYAELLRKNGVILDQRERRETIARELESTAASQGCSLVEYEDLLDTVTFLVEHPFPVLCVFDPAFLPIPDPVLIAEMEEHQKYFPLRDAKGKLVNRFIVISNNPATDHVKEGNVRVVTARFNDARFFYEEDRKMKLADRVDSLKSVLFHKELGSIYDKVERMREIARRAADYLGLGDEDRTRIDRAILLCKTDLNTRVVFEFTSLQGKIGSIYARLDGEEAAVADAIDDHYKPRFQGDPLPTAMTSVIVSIAEKLDNIFGTFSVGNVPKGSHDPYALRRQAGAVVELLIQNGITIPMRELLQGVAGGYKNGGALVDELLSFISARAKTIYTDRGFRYDVVDACLSTGKYDYCELFRIASSIHDFRKNEKFSQMLLSFKRMNNIVTAFRKENPDHRLAFDASLFSEEAERELYRFFEERRPLIEQHLARGEYIQLYEMLIQGKAIIDTFFDKVLVMDKDTRVRDNRLHLLEGILQGFRNLLDFSKLEDVK